MDAQEAATVIPPKNEAEVVPASSRSGVGHFLVPLGAVLALMPFVSAGEALLAGMALALGVGNPFAAYTRRATHGLLSLAIVGLGAGMDLRKVAHAGFHGLGYTFASIAVCLCLGMLIARLLGVPRTPALLISVGTAICGGSAIAAVVPLLKPRDNECSVALGTVFILNAVALFLFPALGHGLALGQTQFGLWSALAIHDTSSVVGAASHYGAEALEVATTVKLARALWIVPLTFAIGAWQRHSHGASEAGKPKRPWFILGYLAAAAFVTFFPGLKPLGGAVFSAAKQVLVLTLFLIGANLSRQALRSVGPRPFAQGVVLWAVMGGLSLGGILLGLIT